MEVTKVGMFNELGYVDKCRERCMYRSIWLLALVAVF